MAMRGSITICDFAEAIRALMERDSVVRPITTTDSGAKFFRIAGEAKKSAACEIASGKESGSSAITGQCRSAAI